MNRPTALSVLTLALLCLVPAAALAGSGTGELGIRLDIGAPTGEFGDNVEDPGFGIIGHFALEAGTNFSFGIGANYLHYGSETRTVVLPLVENLDLETTNQLAGLFLMGQFHLLPGGSTPYFEGRFGGQYLWTSSSVKDKDWFDDDEVGGETNLDDFALQYGVGGGILLRVHEGREQGQPDVLIDFKVMMMQGGAAEYLTEGDIDLVGSTAILHPSETETDLLHFELGVVLGF